MASSAEDYPPYLKKVLRTFQTSAMKSLHGPPSTVEAWRHEDARPLCLVREEPAQSVPVMSTPDPSVGLRTETMLENEMITCFRVGGEDRLVVPHVFATVLREFPIVRINAAIDELLIYVSRCNQEQLNELKAAGVIPPPTATCGLITKTDAERLCAVLLHANPEKFDSVTKMEKPKKAGIRVRHACFGKTRGVLYPQLYAAPEAKCVECADCGGVLTVRQFVSHAHRAKENRTVHWGFSSEMWRVYLRGEEDSKEEELEEIKSRFSSTTSATTTTTAAASTAKKRKGVEEPGAAAGAEEVNDVAGEVKRIKREPQDDNDEDVDNEGGREYRERGDPTALRTGNGAGTPPPLLHSRGAPTPSTVGVARSFVYPPPPFYVGHHPHPHIPPPPPAHHLPPLPHPHPPPPLPPADPGWLYTMWYNAYAASYFTSTTATTPHHYYATPSAAQPPSLSSSSSWPSTAKTTDMVRAALANVGLPAEATIVEKLAVFLEEARHEAYASVQKDLHQLKQQVADLRERNAQLEEKLRMSSAAT